MILMKHFSTPFLKHSPPILHVIMATSSTQSSLLNSFVNVPRSDPRRWRVIYPIYLSANATIKQGRQIPKPLAVVDGPTVPDITEACNRLNLNCKAEPHKCYSRDFYRVGRVRVQTHGDDDKPLHPSINNRLELLVAIAAKINERKK